MLIDFEGGIHELPQKIIKKEAKVFKFPPRKPKEKPKEVRVLTNKQISQLKRDLEEYIRLDYEEFSKKIDLLDPEESDRKRLLELFRVIKQYYGDNEPEIRVETNEDPVVLQKGHLLLASLFRNVLPLLKSIYKQMYPEVDVDARLNFRKDRMFLNSNKPLGDVPEGEINFNVNMRNDYMRPLKAIKYKPEDREPKEKLVVDTYDENDPDIQIFNTNELQEESKGFKEESTDTDNLLEFRDEMFIRSEPLDVIIEESFKTRFDHLKPLSRPKTALMSKTFTDKRFVSTNLINMNFSGNTSKIPEEVGDGISTMLSSDKESMTYLHQRISSSKGLRPRFDSQNIPFPYKVMKTHMRLGSSTRKLNDALIVKHIQQDIKETHRGSQPTITTKELGTMVKDIASKSAKRPQTSRNKSFTRFNSSNIMTHESMGKFNEANALRPIKPHVPAKPVINIYFNNYIDYQLGGNDRLRPAQKEVPVRCLFNK
jgi:hypothetical protein